MTSNETPTILTLFRKLLNTNEVAKLISELESYNGEESKYFKTLVQNLGNDDLSKYKYVFDLVLKINKENPKVTFHDIYFKFLSTNNFEKIRKLHTFLNKLSLEKSEDIESLLYEEEDNDDTYNEIISSMDQESGLALIKEFLSQRSLNFEEYYYQKYLSDVDKLKNKLQNTEASDTNKLYYRYPWITDAVVSKVFIASSEHDIDLFIMNSDSPTVYKSKTWYIPNELFYNFISNQSNARVIKGNDDGVSTLEFMDEKSKVTFSFHILYKLFKNDFNFSFVLLDETIFNLEKKFFAVDYDAVCDDYHVNLFLDDTKMFNQGNIDLLLEFFNKAMSNIQSQYKVTPSLLKLPSMKGVRTLRHLARKISEVTVFLHLDSLSKSIFKKRVIRNYYNQNMIFDLTIEEKLPELTYYTEYNDSVVAYLESSIETEIFNSGESVYRLSRKSMFRPLQKKRVCAPSIKLKYIDEFDDHNYIYYDKKEKWINIKDVLNKQFDDEYTSDVIYPRVKEIFNYEQVMKTPMSVEQFKTKYSLLFHLLEDVIPEDELMEKHRELFLYFPDPAYENNVVEEAPSEVPSESKPEETEESIEPDKPIIIDPVKSESTEERQSVDGTSETPSDDDEDEDVSLPPLLSELNKAVEKSKKAPLADEFNFDEIDSFKQNKKEVDKVEDGKAEIEGDVEDEKEEIEVDDGGGCRDMCCKCKKRSQSECTSTFTHSSKNNKDVKCVTYCYDCLEKHQVDDH
jgi:hypothetical protein